MVEIDSSQGSQGTNYYPDEVNLTADMDDVPSTSSSSNQQPSSTKAPCMVYWDHAAGKMAKVTPAGTEHASMQPSESGFLMAHWLDGTVTETEVPNLSAPRPKAEAKAKGKGKAQGKAKPKPASKAKASQPAAKAKAQSQPASDPALYGMMYYSNTGAVAIRKRTGDKRQLFQLRSASKSREQLEEICKQAIAKLSSGMEVHDVHSWARSRL